jgi:hypothetical protein
MQEKVRNLKFWDEIQLSLGRIAGHFDLQIDERIL